MPRAKPPFPQTSGLWGRPTVVNNVETLCNIPHIINHGADWFLGLGLGADGGTKIYGASGHVRRPGAWELPMGTKLREIIEVHAGGMRDGYELRGVLPGRRLHRVHHGRRSRRGDGLCRGREAGQPAGNGCRHRARPAHLPGRDGAQSGAFFRPGDPAAGAPPAGTGCPGSSGCSPASRRAKASPAISTFSRQHVGLLGPGRTFCAHAPGAMAPLASGLKYFRADFERHIHDNAARGNEHGHHPHRRQGFRREPAGEPAAGLPVAGFDLPYFCWHPALGSVGACRQCAVTQFAIRMTKPGASSWPA